MANEPLIYIENLKKYFPVKAGFMDRRYIKAVDDVSFHIKKGETLGLVGESGCGKTTLGRTAIRLYEPTGGSIFYDGKDITYAKMLTYRKRMQMIFQDPAASLDPRMKAEEIIGEAIDIHRPAGNKKERFEKIKQLLRQVGLNSEHAMRYPHEFSGGQQQRIGIARALAVEPEFIVCDEPVSALDVSVQSQIVNMLGNMQHEMSLTYLFIAHDLSIVRYISDRIAVMYLGNIVELGNNRELYSNPLHPYTKTLLSAIPVPDPFKSRSRRRIILDEDIPSPIDTPNGCSFHTRCPHSIKRCRKEIPAWREVGKNHFVACHII
jgi:oligopeptide transport system ATP-binding protein